MCHAFLGTASFWALLFKIDEDLAAQTREAKCAWCGGELHSARYRRKPRGVGRPLLGDAGAMRLSFCCAREGCRRRHTPPSVRFLERRVFFSAVVILVTALSSGLTGKRVSALCERFGVSVRTLRRWQRWWRERFVTSALWKRLRGVLAAVLAPSSLPGSLLTRMKVEDESERLVRLLRLLSPLSSSSCLREGI
jgi:transposase-like protein